MDDRFERRELLLHLGDMLDALNCLGMASEPGARVTHVVQKDDALQTFEFLRALAPTMTLPEFGARFASAFSQWPRELLETKLNRDALASAVQRNLFEGNPDGWNAYVALIQKKVPWFGIGLPGVKGEVLTEPADGAADKTTPVEPNAPAVSPVESSLPNEKRGWPWPEPKSTS
ncbi:hypothetical protein B0G80_3598 [Paraburkholderia sp. BL6669N2]|uniref:hypothetical protein n=1 Tax=Paraburkholderia sp. BL6669N2 TaxID=1938807 RepID=UPI000E21DC80|nr:hypothetical protein [Paraburkholderia sp. BL6669N2]REG60783.1 hypothetical protein B0G80_3598 [Paraburkholderia sp. BL6669N2]